MGVFGCTMSGHMLSFSLLAVLGKTLLKSLKAPKTPYFAFLFDFRFPQHALLCPGRCACCAFYFPSLYAHITRPSFLDVQLQIFRYNYDEMIVKVGSIKPHGHVKSHTALLQQLQQNSHLSLIRGGR